MTEKGSRPASLTTRLAAYFRAVLRRAPWYRIDIQVLSRRFRCCERSLWYHFRRMRGWTLSDMVFQTVRWGRSYTTIVRRPDHEFRVQTSDYRIGFSSTEEKNPITGETPERESQARTARSRREAEEATAGEARLAHVITRRDLRTRHWDNCKVRFEYGLALRIAKTALVRGFTRESIARAYQIELEELHRTATDVGLMAGDPSLIFEPSKLKSAVLELLSRCDPAQVTYQHGNNNHESPYNNRGGKRNTRGNTPRKQPTKRRPERKSLRINATNTQANQQAHSRDAERNAGAGATQLAPSQKHPSAGPTPSRVYRSRQRRQSPRPPPPASAPAGA